VAKIRMYSTAVCPFCLRAEMLLGSKGATEIEKIRVDLDPRQREEMTRGNDEQDRQAHGAADLHR